MMSLDMFVDALRFGPNNYLKFVVANQEDLLQAIHICKELEACFTNFIISPRDAKGVMIPDIVQGIKRKYPALLNHVIFSVQLHKLVNLP